MSVTFYVPDAPSTKTDCEFCVRARAEGWAEADGRCDRFCRGYSEVSEAPEANFANANAAALLRFLGFPEADLFYGECDAGTLRQRIMRARNKDRSALVREAVEIPGGWDGVQVVKDADGIDRIQAMGPHIFVSGNTDERTMERLSSLEEIAIYAQNRGYKVAWS